MAMNWSKHWFQIFKEAKETGAYAVAALSNDSSCMNMLVNSSYGYERFAFFRGKLWNNLVGLKHFSRAKHADCANATKAFAELSSQSNQAIISDAAETTEANRLVPADVPPCAFPEWLHGEWDTMKIQSDAMYFYHDNDPSTMSTIYGTCGDIKNEKLKVLAKSHW